MSPDFMDLDDVLELHLELISQFGGANGVRDMGLLESALAVPRSGMGGQYFHTDEFEMAAAYLFHLVKNHPFLDGNKRAGAAAALVFLEMNGIEVRAKDDDVVDITLGVAEGRIQKSGVAEFLRKHSSRRK